MLLILLLTTLLWLQVKGISDFYKDKMNTRREDPTDNLDLLGFANWLTEDNNKPELYKGYKEDYFLELWEVFNG